MRRRIAVVAAILLIAAAVSLVAVTLASAGHSAPSSFGRWGQGLPPSASAESTNLGTSTQRIQVIENENLGQSQFIDVGDAGPSSGDYIVFRDPLFDAGQTQKVGDVNVQCIDIFLAALCHGNLHISADKGKIAFEGTVPGLPKVLLSVTGGTAEFEHASGQMKLEVGVPGPGLDTITVALG